MLNGKIFQSIHFSLLICFGFQISALGNPPNNYLDSRNDDLKLSTYYSQEGSPKEIIDNSVPPLDYPIQTETHHSHDSSNVTEKAISESETPCQCEQCCPKGPAPKPWKGLFFDNDFSYKCDPCHPYLFGEELKDVPLTFLGHDHSFSFGGEFRSRYMNEFNRLRPGGAGRSTYHLLRWRNYIDYHYSDLFRVYVEMLDASQFGEELPVTGIDVNRWNLHNAFVDINLLDIFGSPLYFRFGRQELLYGSQRLVSPLDWSNTRRNFEGFKLFTSGKNGCGHQWSFDVFTTRPVNTAAGNGPVARFDNEADHADYSRTFSGVYATYHMTHHKYDGFWFWDRETDAGGTGVDRSRHTIGGRYQYNRPVKNDCCEVTSIWHADIEGGYQFGHQAGLTVKSGYFTAGLGHTWKSLPWAPSLWVYYDWASGDGNPNDGENNTFNQLFPLGHAYLGLIDNVARQNISDFNIKAVVKPPWFDKKISFVSQYHFMDLADSNDTIYNVAGVAQAGTAGVGNRIGNELDLITNINFNPNLNMQIGYSWFWYGSAVDNSPLSRSDANQLWIQTVFRY